MLDFNTLFLLVEYANQQIPALDVEKIRKFKWNGFDCIHSPTSHKNAQIDIIRNNLNFDIRLLLLFASNAYELMKSQFIKTGKYQCKLWIFVSKNLRKCLQIPYEFHVDVERKKIESLELTIAYGFPVYGNSCIKYKLPPTDVYPMTNILGLVNIPPNFKIYPMRKEETGSISAKHGISMIEFIKKDKFIHLQPCKFTDISDKITKQDLETINPDGMQMINVI